MRYLAASVLIAAAGAVYGLFSHGVYSYYMTYAFMIPLIGGAVPHLTAALRGTSCSGSHAAAACGAKRGRYRDVQLAVIAALTTGSLLKGALDIYGTTNRLLIVYPVIAVLAAAYAAVMKAASFRNNRKRVTQDSYYISTQRQQ